MCPHTGREIDMTSDLKRLVDTQRRTNPPPICGPAKCVTAAHLSPLTTLLDALKQKMQQKINRTQQLPLKRVYRRGGMFRPFSTAGRERIRLRQSTTFSNPLRPRSSPASYVLVSVRTQGAVAMSAMV